MQIATETSVQRAYDHIRNQIAAGTFAPGTVLSEATLAKALGVSRTPVGEALRELAGAGLVKQVPRYGTIVQGITRQEIVELYEVREALEPYAVGLAVERISAGDVEKLEKLCQRLRGFLDELDRSGKEELEGQLLRDFLAADMAFHVLLIHAAGNRRAAKLVRDSHVMTDLFGTRRLTHDRKIVSEACLRHEEILEAVRRGDGAAARSAAASHIRTSMMQTLDSIDRRESDKRSAEALPREVREELQRIESDMNQTKRLCENSFTASAPPSPPAPLPKGEGRDALNEKDRP